MIRRSLPADTQALICLRLQSVYEETILGPGYRENQAYAAFLSCPVRRVQHVDADGDLVKFAFVSGRDIHLLDGSFKSFFYGHPLSFR